MKSLNFTYCLTVIPCFIKRRISFGAFKIKLKSGNEKGIMPPVDEIIDPRRERNFPHISQHLKTRCKNLSHSSIGSIFKEFVIDDVIPVILDENNQISI